MGAFEFRSSAPVHRQRRLSVAVLPRRWRVDGARPRRLARQCDLHGAIWRTVHRQPRRRSGEYRGRTGAAARISFTIRICRGASARPSAGSTRPRSRCRRSSPSASAPRNSVIGPGYANVDFALGKNVGGCAAHRNWNSDGRSSICFNSANFDLPNRIFGTPNFGRIFSAKSPREMQIGLRIAF